MSLAKRYAILLMGVISQSAGIAIVVMSLLGTSPISSVPYVLSLIVPFSFGQTTFAVNMLLLLSQILLLGRKFHLVQLLQIPVTVVFAAFIDVFMAVFAGLEPGFYPEKLLLLFVGACLVSLGVALQVIADVLMLSGEGIVYAISQVFRLDFGKVKTGFDCFLVITAALMCLVYLPSIEGIREGTLVSALITGSIARWFIHRISCPDEQGKLVLCLFHKKRKS